MKVIVESDMTARFENSKIHLYRTIRRLRTDMNPTSNFSIELYVKKDTIAFAVQSRSTWRSITDRTQGRTDQKWPIFRPSSVRWSLSDRAPTHVSKLMPRRHTQHKKGHYSTIQEDPNTFISECPTAVAISATNLDAFQGSSTSVDTSRLATTVCETATLNKPKMLPAIHWLVFITTAIVHFETHKLNDWVNPNKSFKTIIILMLQPKSTRRDLVIPGRNFWTSFKL